MAEGHDHRHDLRVGVQMCPRLQHSRQRAARFPSQSRQFHFYLLKNFITSALVTVTPMDARATVRCSRRLLKSVSASLESLTPAYVNPASAANIDSACRVRSVRPSGVCRESQRFQTPVTVLTVK